jgi:cytochrome d ubiquinol oxidase subunit II
MSQCSAFGFIMETIWFAIIAFTLAAYVILDGFDLGAGTAHLFLARNEEERRLILAAIGPFWDGNEVWLLAAGGILYLAFPALYAASFSGFYLPLMMILWLLMLRGIGIEFRSHIDNPLWKSFSDVIFSLSSLLLTIFFRAAMDNIHGPAISRDSGLVHRAHRYYRLDNLGRPRRELYRA